MVKLCQIPPDYFFTVFITERVCNPSFVLPLKPQGVDAEQLRIYCTMADHQVHHQLEPHFFRSFDCFFYLSYIILTALGVQKKWVNSKIVSYRVKASRKSRSLNGVNKNPVETHFSCPP